MLFTFKNIGIVREASVKLDGLTVIGGENDTGKSTVGKLLFAIVKGISRYEQDLKEGILAKRQPIIQKIRSFLIEAKRPISFNWLYLAAMDNEYLLNSIPQFIDFFNQTNFSKEEEIDFLNAIEDLKKVIEEEEPTISKITRALIKAFNSEFYAELTPRFSSNLLSEIEISQNETRQFFTKIEKDELFSLQIGDSRSFEDVTFIDTPAILSLYSVLNNADTLFELESENRGDRLDSISRPKISLHLKDLISKTASIQFRQNKYFDEKKTNLSSILEEKLSAIILGKFIFDKDKSDFIFQKNNGANVRAANTASGIKSFGLIQLLLETRFLDSKSLLVLDEPETHLHPKWQVEYARLIVELVKNDIPVLCTSHSPYLIQALKVFSDAAGISDRTNFYLAEREENKHGTAIISDVTNNLNRLFQKLAEPLRNLVWQ
jgi:hypothetical protein